ncbi:uncharacterized protein N7484_001493 [Penicillium longicatenatum]|uniref:uncharacterized protein n=1 Tax=Penicillium longicatenatum TaxID=1561947 RepID=UPI002548770F|nr:uncharacterized protein N7484_001493 [Penicillium longicatenatum]KAJ5657844.1 hypothetical protein N7484_001493 [Penicillium longicatenatum]
MPIHFYPPPRKKFFDSAHCPPECVIPTCDTQAYQLHPRFRWIYNKLTVAELQGIKCGPHATEPDADLYPIFSKPLLSLWGMGTGARIIKTREEYWGSIEPGHMWCTLLTGTHYSTDIAVVAGKPGWFSHTIGVPGTMQTFDYWEVNATDKDNVQRNLVAFIEAHLGEYTGMLNVESIGGKIIEIHLRFTSQWPDLYGCWFFSSLANLYCGKGWTGPQTSGETAYSVPLFDDEKYAYLSPSIQRCTLQEMKKVFHLSSLVVDYDPTVPLESWPKPKGGFRVLTINGPDLDRCKLVRRMCQTYLHDLYNKQITMDFNSWIKEKLSYCISNFS